MATRYAENIVERVLECGNTLLDAIVLLENHARSADLLAWHPPTCDGSCKQTDYMFCQDQDRQGKKGVQDCGGMRVWSVRDVRGKGIWRDHTLCCCCAEQYSSRCVEHSIVDGLLYE